MNSLIDFHLHSTASDGSKSPAEIIEIAAEQARLQDAKVYMALTDHDTLSGIPEFLKEAARYPDLIHAVSGLEISCDYKNTEIHMLGYQIDPNNQVLLEKLKGFRKERDRRNGRIIAKLNALGMDISENELEPLHEGDSIGKPAIARLLMKKGYVSSVKEAFDLYLGTGRSCHVSRKKPSPREAIRLIQESGGYAVLAHPVLYKKLSQKQIHHLLQSCAKEGLAGLEVYYSKNTDDDTAYYHAIAQIYHLYESGGSDYHGDAKPDIQLFTGKGNLKVPETILANLPYFQKKEEKI